MKARQYAAYSPAYSPAMSGSGSKVHLGLSHSGADVGSAGGASSKTIVEQQMPVQSPLYVPPSMGGKGGGAAVVQSPQYVPHAGIVSGSDVV